MVLTSDFCGYKNSEYHSNQKKIYYNVKSAVVHTFLGVTHFTFMMPTKIFQNSDPPPSPTITI